MRPKRYISNMTALGMSAMAARTQVLSKSPEFDAMSHDELLNDITQFQLDTTRQEKLERNIKSAKLPFPSASLETLPVFIKRQIDTHYLNRIAECDWIRNKQNLIVTGLDEKAAAKLASSIARKAIENDFKVKYHDITSLLERFFIYRSEPQTGSKSPIIKLLDELKRPDVIFFTRAWTTSHYGFAESGFISNYSMAGRKRRDYCYQSLSTQRLGRNAW